MTATKAPRLTLTAAAKAARELGFTLRKTAPGESEIVVYRKGAGQDAAHAYFTDCPADALQTARAMAADDKAGRLTLTGKPATAVAFATIAAEDNAKAAADYAADFAGDSTAEARRLSAEAREELDKARQEGKTGEDVTACHYDATRAALLYGRAIRGTAGHGRRARLQEARDAATAMAALAFELMIQAAKRDAGALAALVPDAESVPASRDAGGAFALAAFKARQEGKTGEDVTAAAEAAAEAAARKDRAEARKAARAEGHAAEDRADALTGEARAAELDKAAAAFDRAAANPTPGGMALGHYATRARVCREEAAAIRCRVELDKRGRFCPRCGDYTDSAVCPYCGWQIRGPRSLSAAANPEAPEGRKAARRRLKTRRELEAAATLPGIAGDLARLSLQAVNVPRDSGGFPLYAFRDRRAIDPEELDAMAYGRATAGLV